MSTLTEYANEIIIKELISFAKWIQENNLTPRWDLWEVPGKGAFEKEEIVKMFLNDIGLVINKE